MAWNEPGGNNNDPEESRWKEQGPPDLDMFLNLFASWESQVATVRLRQSLGGIGAGILVGLLVVSIH